MDDIDTLTIGEAKAAVARGKEVEALLGGASCSQKQGGKINGTAIDYGLQIVILDRGFVFVGDVTADGEWVVVSNARNIRRWGTSKGLGELAAKGPLAETKIDHAGTVRAPMRALIGLLKCEAASWTK